MPPSTAQSPTATTHLGSGVALYVRSSASRMFLVTGPVTSSTSARRRHKAEPEAFQIIEGIVERVDFEFAAVARAGIDLPNRETATQTPPRCSLDAGAQLGQHLLVLDRRCLGQWATHQALEQNSAHEVISEIVTGIGAVERFVA